MSDLIFAYFADGSARLVRDYPSAQVVAVAERIDPRPPVCLVVGGGALMPDVRYRKSALRRERLIYPENVHGPHAGKWEWMPQALPRSAAPVRVEEVLVEQGAPFYERWRQS